MMRKTKFFAILPLIIIFFQLNIALAGSNLKRYISLAPSTTEILFALGLDDQIVGVSSYCNYPEKAKTKLNLGEFSHPNLEKILSLKPSYIFCTGLEQAPIVNELIRQKLKVYVSDPANIQELLVSISDIGKITNNTEAAEILIDKIKTDISDIQFKVKLVSSEAKPKVFIEIWSDPLTTAGKGSFIDEILSLAGGINIASNTKRPFSIYNAEEVIKQDPDCIILTYMDKEKPLKLLSSRLGWDKIKAVKNNCIYNDINPDLLLRPGPRITEGLKELYKRIYKNEPAD